MVLLCNYQVYKQIDQNNMGINMAQKAGLFLVPNSDSSQQEYGFSKGFNLCDPVFSSAKLE